MPISALKVVLYKVCNWMVPALITATILPELLGSKVNIPNFSLLRSLEPFKKFVVVVSGWVVVCKPFLVISLWPKSRLIYTGSGV